MNKKADGKADGENDDVIIVKEVVKIKDGVHSGTITNMIRDIRKGFDYVDVYIETEDEKGNDATIKAGFPCNISDVSSFGKLIRDSGISFTENQALKLSEIKEHLLDKSITFTTFTDGDFARVINKTIEFNQ